MMKKITMFMLIFVLLIPLVLGDDVNESNSTNGDADITPEQESDGGIFNIGEDTNMLIFLLTVLFIASLLMYYVGMTLLSVLFIILAGFIIIGSTEAWFIGVLIILSGFVLSFK